LGEKSYLCAGEIGQTGEGRRLPSEAKEEALIYRTKKKGGGVIRSRKRMVL